MEDSQFEGFEEELRRIMETLTPEEAAAFALGVAMARGGVSDEVVEAIAAWADAMP